MFAFDKGSEAISLAHMEGSRGEGGEPGAGTMVTFEIDEDRPRLDYVPET